MIACSLLEFWGIYWAGSEKHPPVLIGLKNFFVSVSTLVCFKMPGTKRSPLDYSKIRNMNSSIISPVTHSENEDLFLSFKNGESTGPFSTPVKLLKLVIEAWHIKAFSLDESINLGIFSW